MNVETLTLVNVAIVLFALFFFISTLASHMLEVLVGLFNCRGRLLHDSLGKALSENVAREIYASPPIKSLASDGVGNSSWYAPSYIEPEMFARTAATLADNDSTFASRSDLFDQLRSDAARSGSSLDAKIAEWYRAFNDRQTGVYTRWSTWRLFLIGLALAAAMDLDVVHMGIWLWESPELAERFASQIEQQFPQATPGDAAAFDQATKEELAKTMAWLLAEAKASAETQPAFAWQQSLLQLDWTAWFLKAMGWGLAALAASLGAQFWFNLLSETLKLRAAGRKPETDASSASTADASATESPVSTKQEPRIEPASLVFVAEPQEPFSAPIGVLSAKYEVGGRGPGTVSSGQGDIGGVSYGSYQMTSRPDGGTVADFVRSDEQLKLRFGDREPGTAGFTEKWKQYAADAPEEFFALQHEYIKKTHYDPLALKIKDELGLDAALRSNALQNVVWSTAVQHGPKTRVIGRAVDRLQPRPDWQQPDPELDRRLIRAVYAERGKRDQNGALAYFRNNSTQVQNSVAKRFVDEERDALRMLDNEAKIDTVDA